MYRYDNLSEFERNRSGVEGGGNPREARHSSALENQEYRAAMDQNSGPDLLSSGGARAVYARRAIGINHSANV